MAYHQRGIYIDYLAFLPELTVKLKLRRVRYKSEFYFRQGEEDLVFELEIFYISSNYTLVFHCNMTEEKIILGTATHRILYACILSCGNTFWSLITDRWLNNVRSLYYIDI